MVVAYLGCFDSKKMTSMVAYLLLKKDQICMFFVMVALTPKHN